MGLKKIQEKQIKLKTKMNSRHQNPVHLTNYTLLLIVEKAEAEDLLKLKTKERFYSNGPICLEFPKPLK